MIRIENVTKRFPGGQDALRGLSLNVDKGEMVFVTGHSGAGKSTLLKMITGTLQSTEGQLQVNGRIAAILELGMGFNPDLTGCQNVFHTAGLMGFSAGQIQQAIPEIEEFAEIGEYFNEPMRTYSSGMQMRVAFAVATAYNSSPFREAMQQAGSIFDHSEVALELTYRAPITPWLAIQPDVQYIINPGTDPSIGNALVVGARLEFSF